MEKISYTNYQKRGLGGDASVPKKKLIIIVLKANIRQPYNESNLFIWRGIYL